MRTANDFNREYMYRCWGEEVNAAGQPRKGSSIKSVIFYGVLLIMVILAFFYSNGKESGKQFGPFAYNTVLTGSMQSVYPQGSLIASWAIKEGEVLKAGLSDGTDLVFVKEDGTVVVHRIIEIIDNYDDTGMRAFRTQGVENPGPDSWITYEGNVIGRVTWHIPYAGDALAIIADNIIFVIGFIILIAILLTLWKIVFKKENS